MSSSRPSPRVVGYSLAAVVAGLWLMRDVPLASLNVFDRLDVFGRLNVFERLAALDPFGRGRPVRLTGLGRDGRVEVPVINLWAQPGFGNDNEVAGRVPVLEGGEVEARLVNQIEIDGLTWDEVRFGEARGWVVSRFVAE